jgi:hypothetical protein
MSHFPLSLRERAGLRGDYERLRISKQSDFDIRSNTAEDGCAI